MEYFSKLHEYFSKVVRWASRDVEAPDSAKFVVRKFGSSEVRKFGYLV